MTNRTPVSAVSGPITAAVQGPLPRWASATPYHWNFSSFDTPSEALAACMAWVRFAGGAAWVRETIEGTFMCWPAD